MPTSKSAIFPLDRAAHARSPRNFFTSSSHLVRSSVRTSKSRAQVQDRTRSSSSPTTPIPVPPSIPVTNTAASIRGLRKHLPSFDDPSWPRLWSYRARMNVHDRMRSPFSLFTPYTSSTRHSASHSAAHICGLSNFTSS